MVPDAYFYWPISIWWMMWWISHQKCTLTQISKQTNASLPLLTLTSSGPTMSICSESLSGVGLSLWVSVPRNAGIGEGESLPDFDWLDIGDGVRDPATQIKPTKLLDNNKKQRSVDVYRSFFTNSVTMTWTKLNVHATEEARNVQYIYKGTSLRLEY